MARQAKECASDAWNASKYQRERGQWKKKFSDITGRYNDGNFNVNNIQGAYKGSLNDLNNQINNNSNANNTLLKIINASKILKIENSKLIIKINEKNKELKECEINKDVTDEDYNILL